VAVREWNSEIPTRHERHGVLYLFGPPESKTLRPVWWRNYAWKRESSAPEEGVGNVPLRGAPGRLILAGMPWVTSQFPSILLGYNMESLSELDCLVLYTKLSSYPWAHISGRVGSTDRSAGLLVGRARLSGTTETLVGGDPWVPMSHKPPIDV
jgi:hypothetical protein